jgi:hypothetical protein
VGPNDHDGLCHSIYFHDNNGIRLELTAPIDPDWNNHIERSRADLEKWQAAKQLAQREGRNLRDAMLELIRQHHRE